MDKVKYSAGLNEFSYCATLHISHPTIDPSEITAALQIEPSRMSRVGQAHRSVPGRVYDFSHWSSKLPAKDHDDIPTFLARLVSQLSRHRNYLHELSDSGGEIECFIGIFPTRLCDQQYSHNLLAMLADLRIDLRLDYYDQPSA